MCRFAHNISGGEADCMDMDMGRERIVVLSKYSLLRPNFERERNLERNSKSKKAPTSSEELMRAVTDVVSGVWYLISQN